MAIAKTLKAYLDENHVHYDTVEHVYTESAEDSAMTAHIPRHQMAKAVVLEDDNGIVVSVVPANHRLNLHWVNEDLGRNLELVPEEKLKALFRDCDAGAIPALSNAYGLDVIWDDQLKNAADIYIEAGDHRHLIHMPGVEFEGLMSALPHSIISTSGEYDRPMFD